mgnify:CR=1 FL=1
MFALSSKIIRTPPLQRHIVNAQSGALVIFEGRVRGRSGRKKVRLLEYEASPALTRKEFEKIEAEAFRKFDILAIRCVHRCGKVKPGGIAVWLAVAAKHRGEAFRGCAWTIDAIKKRLSIWKKEHYADGSSRWL